MTAATNERDALLPTLRFKATPLPKLQLAILTYMRLAEPIGFMVIFPFVNKMVEELHIASPANVGYYSGVIESAFALSQFLVILQWGRLSDRVGRRPVLCIGLLGVFVSVAAFGFSQSLWAMIAARCCAGLLNGNAGVIKSAFAELTDKTNEGRAFAILPLSFAVGSAIGLFIGGQLANPADRFPALFGKVIFFQTWPYVLPCFVAALFPLSAAILGFFCLEETLPSKVAKSQQDLLATEEESLLPRPQAIIEPLPPTILSLLSDRKVLAVLVNYMILALFTMGLSVIIPLFSYTNAAHGGLGFRPDQIGDVMAGQAVLVVLFQSVAFAPLQKLLGTITLYRVMINFYPVAIVLFAIASATTGSNVVFAPFIGALICISIGNMVYSCNMLTINAAAPTKNALGTLNGLAQTCSSLMRGIAPSAASSLFAYSISHPNILNGRLIWVVMGCLTLLSSALTWTLPDSTPEWREQKK